MNIRYWLDRATKEIRFAPDREAVRRELENHIEDLCDRYVAKGLSAEDAEAQAISEMGDAAEIAPELGKLHRPWWGYLWRASQWLLGLLVIHLVALVLMDAVQLPGQTLYNYLTWTESDYFAQEDYHERTYYTANGQVVTAGNTIAVETIYRDKFGATAPNASQVLTLDFDIHLDTLRASINFSDAIVQVTDSAGTIYPNSYIPGSRSYWDERNRSSWLWWQKGRITLFHPPEDIQWLEITLGFEEYQKVMHIALIEEVAP